MLAWLAIGPSGCSEELGPEHMAVARVKGFVKEGLRPVSGGWIEFYSRGRDCRQPLLGPAPRGRLV